MPDRPSASRPSAELPAAAPAGAARPSGPPPRVLWVSVLLAASLSAGCGGDDDTTAGTVTLNGRTWRVELATEPAAQAVGLAHRTSLAEDRGMLFVFPRPQPLRFHMRDCLIPLDIAFIDSQLRVVNTHTMAVEPGGRATRHYPSAGPAQYALEVPAGGLAGVEPGDRVTN